MTGEVVWPIVVPLAGALLCSIVPPRLARWVAGASALGTWSVAAALARAVLRHGPLDHAVGAWPPPLGIPLRADGLGAALLFSFGAVAVLVSGQAIVDARRGPRLQRSVFSLWLFSWAALNALVLSADIFNLYVTLELTTFAAISLIAIDGSRDALRAGLRYLLVALVGSLVYLLGVAILYGVRSSLELEAFGERISEAERASWAAFALMTVGLCLKAALFPLHGWLPPAYLSARPTVAALLSSLLGKAPFLVLLRLWFNVFPTDFELRVGPLLGVLGSASIIGGALIALRQARLRALIAYSSIAQIGYLFLVFPINSPEGWTGGVYLALAHAPAKASMFLAAGTIERAIGGDRLDGLQGVARQLPMTSFSLALAGVSLMGMPPSGGFVAKWLMVRAALQRGEWWWAATILIGGLLGAAYVYRVLRQAFSPPLAGARFAPVHRLDELAALGLALIALLLGILPSLLIDLSNVGRSS